MPEVLKSIADFFLPQNYAEQRDTLRDVSEQLKRASKKTEMDSLRYKHRSVMGLATLAHVIEMSYDRRKKEQEE